MLSKRILFLTLFLFQLSPVYANDISIYSFNGLMDSNPISGDSLILENNLNSNETIGGNFLGLDINFVGNNHYIDGQNIFGGFVLNRTTNFDEMIMLDCRGQEYLNSYFAGALFNNGGTAMINTSVFNNNYADAQGVNFAVGGALYNLNGAYMEINSVLFQNNYAKGASSYGGAVANGYLQGDAARMAITDSIFYGNYSSGSVTPFGGALYNNGDLNVSNTLFDNNYILSESGSFAYGGAIYNNDELVINNSLMQNNYINADDNAFAFGGAIFNNGNLIIENSNINSNYVSSNTYSIAGAVYNNTDKTTTIINSIFENNHTSDAVEKEGGAIYNSGILNIENSTFRNNFEGNDTKNDIFNSSSGTVNFNSDGTTNILSGIKGSGIINKNDSGALNLGSDNLGFTGDFYFNEGTINLLNGAGFFGSANNYFSDGVILNLQNSSIDNVSFNNLYLTGTTNIFSDVNLNTNTGDTISANNVSGEGSVFVKNLKIEGAPTEQYTSIPFSNSVLKDYISYESSKILTPIYEYNVRYDSSNGDFVFERGNFNPSILSSSIAAQMGGYISQIDTFKNVFSNLDMVMINPFDTSAILNFDDKFADKNFSGGKLYRIPEQHKGLWFKPYSLFEKVPLDNGPDVSNVGYGSILGFESGIKRFNKDTFGIFGGYISYNGSHQAFLGNDIYNNGGFLGFTASIYKKNFFSLWAIDAGAFSSNASNKIGNENFSTLNAGISQKTGCNFKILKNRLILQPSIMTSYVFSNTFDYKQNYVDFNTKPLNAIHIEPMIKLIGNFENNLQPYLLVSFAWNILDKTRFRANDVYLPELSVKPYVQYGAGVQKRFSDRLTAFFETVIRNAGREGVYLQLGLRFSL